MGKMSTNFDFLVNLHKTNPVAFAEYHDEAIEEYIQSLPESRQLAARQFQWNLKGDLAKFKNPTAKMNRMVELFWEQTNVFGDSLAALSESVNGNENK